MVSRSAWTGKRALATTWLPVVPTSRWPQISDQPEVVRYACSTSSGDALRRVPGEGKSPRSLQLLWAEVRVGRRQERAPKARRLPSPPVLAMLPGPTTVDAACDLVRIDAPHRRSL